MMLTKKQKELFEYLSDYIYSNSISPSFEEMKRAVNLKSKSGIHRLITSLEQRGFIRRLKHKARAMEIIKTLKSNSNFDDKNKSDGIFLLTLNSTLAVASTPAFPVLTRLKFSVTLSVSHFLVRF